MFFFVTLILLALWGGSLFFTVCFLDFLRRRWISLGWNFVHACMETTRVVNNILFLNWNVFYVLYLQKKRKNILCIKLLWYAWAFWCDVIQQVVIAHMWDISCYRVFYQLLFSIKRVKNILLQVWVIWIFRKKIIIFYTNLKYFTFYLITFYLL